MLELKNNGDENILGLSELIYLFVKFCIVKIVNVSSFLILSQYCVLSSKDICSTF